MSRKFIFTNAGLERPAGYQWLNESQARTLLENPTGVLYPPPIESTATIFAPTVRDQRIVAPPLVYTTQQGTAIDFDSNADRVISSTPPSTTAFTLCGWVRITTDRNAESTFVSLENTAGTQYIVMGAGSDGTTLTVGDSTQGNFLFGPSLTVGTWYFVSLAHNGTDTVLSYAAEGATTVTEVTGNNAGSITANKIMFANARDAAFSAFLNGRLRNWKIYTGIRLSKTQVEVELNSAEVVRTTDLHAFYKFNTVAAMLVDSGPNGYTLTNPGSAGAWTVGAGPNIAPDPLDNVIAPTVVKNAYILTPPLLGSTAQFFAATVNQVGTILAPPIVGSTATIFAPIVRDQRFVVPPIVYSSVTQASSIRLNAAADRLQLGTVPAQTAYTISLWAKIAVDRNTFSVIWAFENSSGAAYQELVTDSDGTTAKVWDSTNGAFLTGPNMTVGTWYHLVFGHDSADQTNDYLTYKADGGGYTTVTGNQASAFTAVRLLLGWDNSGGDPFYGDFATTGLKTWSVRLSQGDAQAEGGSISPIVTSNLHTFHPLQSLSQMLVDSGPNGYNLTNPTGTGSWTVETGPSLNIGTGSIIYTPAGVTNVNVLQPPLIASTSQIFTHSISVSGAITPPLLASTAQFFSATVRNVNTLVAPLIASTSQIFAPTVRDQRLVQPPVIASTTQFFSASISNTVNLRPPLVGPSSQIFAPTVTKQPYLLTAPLIGSTSQIFVPTVVKNAYVLAAPLRASTVQIFSPSVTSVKTLVVPQIASTAQFFAEVVTNVNRLLPPLLSATSQIYTPTVKFTQFLVPPRINSTVTFGAHAITQGALLAPLIGSTAQIFAPTLLRQPIILAVPRIESTAVVYTPTVHTLATLIVPAIAATSTVNSPIVRATNTVVVPAIGSTSQLFSPALTVGPVTLTPPQIASTSQIFAPTVAVAGFTLMPPMIAATSQVFTPGPASQLYTLYPPLLSTYTIYAPSVIYRELSNRVSEHLLYLKSLELPLPATLTRIYGIHQSDVVIAAALKVAIADMRANPWLLDYVFASLPQDPVTWREYGEKSVQAAKDWFLKTNIPIVVTPTMNELKVPAISIALVSSEEVTQEATLGDVNYDSYEDNDTLWPALCDPFTPKRYLGSTGTVELRTAPVDFSLFPGMFIVDKRGRPYEIVEVHDDVTFTIAADSVPDLRDAVFKSHRPAYKVSVESSSFRESYRVGVHVGGEPVYLTWLHSIIVFALLRYKEVLLEARGFERSTLSSTDFAHDPQFETEIVFSRYINLSGHVRQFWPKNVSRVLDGVELDLRVSGQNADVLMKGAVADIRNQLWIGNLDDRDEVETVATPVTTPAGVPPAPIEPPSGAVLGLAAWNVDGTNNSSVTGNGYATPLWKNTSGGTVSDGLPQSAPYYPHLKTSDALQPSCVTFDGIADYFHFLNSQSTLAFLHNTGVFDMFIVMRRLQGGLRPLVGSTNTTGNKGLYTAINADGQLNLVLCTAGTPIVNATSTATAAIGAPVKWHIRGTGSALRLSTDFSTYQNVPYTGSVVAGNATFPMALGSLGTFGMLENFGGDIYEFHLYDRNLTPIELSQMQQYILEREGI